MRMTARGGLQHRAGSIVWAAQALWKAQKEEGMIQTKRMAVCGMLAAMCAVLGYVAINTGNFKLTFESFPIMLGALLLGPVDGMLIGGIGTLIYQILRFGVTMTTVLWMLPYVLCGAIVGGYAKRKNFSLSRREVLVLVILNECLITAVNTAVLYIDSKLYGYYSPVFIFGTLGPRIFVCLAKGAVFGAALPGVVRAVRRAVVRNAF